MSKRFFALLLCLAMCLALFPASAFAEEEISVTPDLENEKDIAAMYSDDPAGGSPQTVRGEFTSGASFSLSINTPGTFVYFSFVPDVSDVYYMSSESGVDTVGYIYSSEWALLAREDDTEGMAGNFKVGHYLTAGETYYFCAGLYNASITADLRLTLTKEHTGWVRKGSDWYYYHEDSTCADGKVYVNGEEYGFYPDGRMAVNDCIYDEEDERYYFAGSDGAIRTEPGWAKGYDGKYYYVVSGSRLLDHEWIKDKGVWYYMVPEMAKDGCFRYYYDEAACYLCYFKPNGAWDNTAGWKQNSRKTWFYVDGSGHAVTGWKNFSGSWYFFDEDGAMATGWKMISRKWYYFSASGAMQVRWQKIGSRWYYFESSGAMATGWKQISGKWYYFNLKGAMAVGWAKIDNFQYYFDSNGAMVTGWKQISGKWYYFSGSGAMQVGWQKIGSSWYYFVPSGSMTTGWAKIGSAWYYFASNGVMQTGWLKYDGNWFYLDSNGAMLQNTSRQIGSKTYHFDGSGKCTNP